MHVHVRRSAFTALAALAFLCAAPARADDRVPRTAADTTAPVTLVTATDSGARALQGPTAAAAAVAMRARPAAAAAMESGSAAQARMGLGQSRALMIVGLATFIAGAIIPGDAGTIVMLGGAAIGLYGLYQYLQ